MRFVILLILPLSLSFSTPVVAQERQREKVYTGQIVKVENGFVWTNWPSGIYNPVNLYPGEKTKYYLDGREVRVTELPMPVRADFTYSEKLIIVRIHAYTRENSKDMK